MTTTGINLLYLRAETKTSKTPEYELSVILKVGREFVSLCAICKVHDIMHGNSLRNRSSYDHDVKWSLKRGIRRTVFYSGAFAVFRLVTIHVAATFSSEETQISVTRAR